MGAYTDWGVYERYMNGLVERQAGGQELMDGLGTGGPCVAAHVDPGCVMRGGG